VLNVVSCCLHENADASRTEGETMSDQIDLAVSRIAALVGEPARTRILYSLMDLMLGQVLNLLRWRV
jgi:hypothetical protein